VSQHRTEKTKNKTIEKSFKSFTTRERKSEHGRGDFQGDLYVDEGNTKEIKQRRMPATRQKEKIINSATRTTA